MKKITFIFLLLIFPSCQTTEKVEKSSQQLLMNSLKTNDKEVFRQHPDPSQEIVVTFESQFIEPSSQINLLVHIKNNLSEKVEIFKFAQSPNYTVNWKKITTSQSTKVLNNVVTKYSGFIFPVTIGPRVGEFTVPSIKITRSGNAFFTQPYRFVVENNAHDKRSGLESLWLKNEEDKAKLFENALRNGEN